MPRMEKQKLKLLYVLQILERSTDENHPMNMQTLIERLSESGINAERKSIYNDVAMLQEFGFDICYSKSSLNNGYFLGTRDFELPELNLLVDAVQASRYITSAKSRTLISKIEKLCSDNEAKELRKQVYVRNRIKTDNESIYYDVDMIHRAMRENCRIAFQYMEWNFDKKLVPRRGGKIYDVSPWALTCSDDNYYMVSYDGQADMIKHFRVDKMGRMKVLEDCMREGGSQFEKFDIAKYTNHVFGMYGGQEQEITLSFPNDMIGIAIDRFGRDVTIMRIERERFHLCTEIAVSHQFYGWLAGIGPEVRIIAPAEVRTGYYDYLTSITKSVIQEDKNGNKKGDT